MSGHQHQKRIEAIKRRRNEISYEIVQRKRERGHGAVTSLLAELNDLGEELKQLETAVLLGQVQITVV